MDGKMKTLTKENEDLQECLVEEDGASAWKARKKKQSKNPRRSCGVAEQNRTWRGSKNGRCCWIVHRAGKQTRTRHDPLGQTNNQGWNMKTNSSQISGQPVLRQQMGTNIWNSPPKSLIVWLRKWRLMAHWDHLGFGNKD